jgi:molybdopterin converting factor small subunit
VKQHIALWRCKKMPAVTCKYFTTVLDITKKDIETIEVGSGITVEEFLDQLIVKYGEKFGRHIYAEGTLDGKPYKTPNIYLNKSRIQWVQDFPDGLKTKLKDGDILWLGLIIGGGALQLQV